MVDHADPSNFHLFKLFHLLSAVLPKLLEFSASFAITDHSLVEILFSLGLWIMSVLILILSLSSSSLSVFFFNLLVLKGRHHT